MAGEITTKCSKGNLVQSHLFSNPAGITNCDVSAVGAEKFPFFQTQQQMYEQCSIELWGWKPRSTGLALLLNRNRGRCLRTHDGPWSSLQCLQCQCRSLPLPCHHFSRRALGLGKKPRSPAWQGSCRQVTTDSLFLSLLYISILYLLLIF